ncbi:hypothetical protein EW14_1502 [Prochlorococcus sp. MIT 0604]|nr:hypothetical protein EW14_1502 [Prochlorococcus sp. MIT 0604]
MLKIENLFHEDFKNIKLNKLSIRLRDINEITKKFKETLF